MLWFPFLGAWGNYFLDVVDGDILLNLGVSDATYQTIDKFADLVSYVFMLLLGLRWPIRKIIIALFTYRLVGQILFFITRNELMFVYFQNFLEPLVMAYTLILVLNKSNQQKAYAAYQKYFFLVWGLVIGYKLWNEWYLHYANIDLSLFFFGFTGGQ
jgi:hypothetical protein